MDWARVGRYIRGRIDEMRATKAEILRASGLSDKTLTAYMNGAAIKRADKERALCEALGWTTDSIRLVGAGGEPIETNGVDRVSELEGRVDRLEALLRAARDELAGDQ